MIPPYDKIWIVGRKEATNLTGKLVVVEEKYDGSHISWANINGKLYVRSKNASINPEYPPSGFTPAVVHIEKKSNILYDGFIYRGEALRGPKHNTIRYGRCPLNNIVLYDVFDPRTGFFFDNKRLEVEASRLEIEPVLQLGSCKFDPFTSHEPFQNTMSSLGGSIIEGVIFKDRTSGLYAKWVRPEFKEQHKANIDWKKGKDLITAIADSYKTPARWLKAVQRYAESNKIAYEPRDIGGILKEMNIDWIEECEEEAKELLWQHARKQMLNHFKRGFAEWYKETYLKEVKENG